MSAAADRPARLAALRAAAADEEMRPVLVACGAIVLLLAVGTAHTLATLGQATMLSPAYLLQQMQAGAFLGIVAAGMMLVILLGQIDLSVAWTLAAAAMVATAVGGAWAIPAGLLVGLAAGLFNGFGVAVLRVPAMVFTLGTNAVLRGLMVAATGGYAPQTAATSAMQWLAVGRVGGVPVAVLVWTAVSLGVAGLLSRTVAGRQIYAIGNSEAAAYLAGVRTRRVVVLCFALCGMCAGLSGVLLAGYATKAYQGMGDAYVLPAVAAVVVGGTRILGGRGRYLGTVVGAVLMVLLGSVLSLMQLPSAGRQIAYGAVIVAMLLLYGRKA